MSGLFVYWVCMQSSAKCEIQSMLCIIFHSPYNSLMRNVNYSSHCLKNRYALWVEWGKHKIRMQMCSTIKWSYISSGNLFFNTIGPVYSRKRRNSVASVALRSFQFERSVNERPDRWNSDGITVLKFTIRAFISSITLAFHLPFHIWIIFFITPLDKRGASNLVGKHWSC